MTVRGKYWAIILYTEVLLANSLSKPPIRPTTRKAVPQLTLANLPEFVTRHSEIQIYGTMRAILETSSAKLAQTVSIESRAGLTERTTLVILRSGEAEVVGNIAPYIHCGWRVAL